MSDALEGKVRPAVTVILVLAQIFLAYSWAVLGSDSAKDAFAGLMPLTSMVLLFYFKSRDEEKAQQSTAAAVAAATGTGNGGGNQPPPPAPDAPPPASPPAPRTDGGTG